MRRRRIKQREFNVQAESGTRSAGPGVGTVVRTLRHLRARQIVTRVKNRVLGYRLSVEESPAPQLALRRLRASALAPRTSGLRGLSSDGSSVRFLGVSAPFPLHGEGGQSLLWRFNYHYLDWLWQLDGEEALSQLEAWEKSFPFPTIPAWHPYVVSKRLINLAVLCRSRWLHVLASNEALSAHLSHRITQHQRYLLQNLEYDVDVNHLLTNAIAGTAASTAFAGPADGGAERFEELLREELAAQFLPDGGHVERSPGYQIELTHQLTQLLNCLRDEPFFEELSRTVERSLCWIEELSDAAGEPYLLNDSAVEETVSAAELRKFAERVLQRKLDASYGRRPLLNLPETGYVRIETGDFRLICDAAAIGPEHNSGHGHADFLSFILFARGMPLVVDSGNFDYQRGALRSYFRSTEAHSTVELNGENSVELWSAFRVGRRSIPKILQAELLDTPGATVVAEHYGYAHLPGSPRVVRRWICLPELLVVSDLVVSAEPVSAVSRLHLHPMWRCTSVSSEERSAELSCAFGTDKVYVGSSSSLELEAGHKFSPGFGKLYESEALRLSFEGGASAMRSVFVISFDKRRCPNCRLEENSAILAGQKVDWSSRAIDVSGHII